MSYKEKLELVETSLISYCKECIIENWGGMFDMWLSFDADMEFGNGYKKKFNEQFSKYMNSEIEDKLWFAGNHIIFAINAFTTYKNDANLDDVLNFTEMFILAQIGDFDNWCGDIRQSMYEETSDYERDCDDLNNMAKSS